MQKKCQCAFFVPSDYISSLNFQGIILARGDHPVCGDASRPNVHCFYKPLGESLRLTGQPGCETWSAIVRPKPPNLVDVRIFFIFSAWGKGRGSQRRQERGGRFLLKIPGVFVENLRRGGMSLRGEGRGGRGREGPGGVCGEWGGS